jgi:hypothetical protein
VVAQSAVDVEETQAGHREDASGGGRDGQAMRSTHATAYHGRVRSADREYAGESVHGRDVPAVFV